MAVQGPTLRGQAGSSAHPCGQRAPLQGLGFGGGGGGPARGEFKGTDDDVVARNRRLRGSVFGGEAERQVRGCWVRGAGGCSGVSLLHSTRAVSGCNATASCC